MDCNVTLNFESMPRLLFDLHGDYLQMNLHHMLVVLFPQVLLFTELISPYIAGNHANICFP